MKQTWHLNLVQMKLLAICGFFYKWNELTGSHKKPKVVISKIMMLRYLADEMRFTTKYPYN